MEIINVKASKEYDVHIGEGLLCSAGIYLLSLASPCKVVVVTDNNVFPFYGEPLLGSLIMAGYNPFVFIIPHGEQSKSLSVYEKLLNFMCKHDITKSDILISLGGGVVGDLSGFAAATYQRGITFVQVPTTLLAAVDSSVGGKTAVNFSDRKNQIGAFYQPSLVLCDIDTLLTLPDEEYINGCAEIIKYAVITGTNLYNNILNTPIKDQYERVIAACVSIKADLVNEDEYDNGKRRLLNLGHSFGHAIEAISEYTIPHGQAVAIGLSLITKTSYRHNKCNSFTRDKIINLLKLYELPTENPYSKDEIYKHAINDKKVRGETITLIVPHAIGKCEMIDVEKTDILNWIG